MVNSRIGNIISDGIISKKVPQDFIQNEWHSELSMEDIPGEIVHTPEHFKRKPGSDSVIYISKTNPKRKQVIIRTEKDWYNWLNKVI